MLLIHKLFKKHSLQSLASKLLVVAAASVFLVCKVRYTPVHLDKVAQAMFFVWVKLLSGGDVATVRGDMATTGPRSVGLAAVPEFTE